MTGALLSPANERTVYFLPLIFSVFTVAFFSSATFRKPSGSRMYSICVAHGALAPAIVTWFCGVSGTGPGVATAAPGILAFAADALQPPAARFEIDGANVVLVGKLSPVGRIRVELLPDAAIPAFAGNDQRLHILRAHRLQRIVDNGLQIGGRIGTPYRSR